MDLTNHYSVCYEHWEEADVIECSWRAKYRDNGVYGSTHYYRALSHEPPKMLRLQQWDWSWEIGSSLNFRLRRHWTRIRCSFATLDIFSPLAMSAFKIEQGRWINFLHTTLVRSPVHGLLSSLKPDIKTWQTLSSQVISVNKRKLKDVFLSHWRYVWAALFLSTGFMACSITFIVLYITFSNCGHLITNLERWI